MAEYQMTARWTEGIAFDVEINDFKVRMDSVPPEGNNTGPSPKRMVLAGLICCTGMDVASLLRKMRVKFDSMEIEAKAPITAEHPKTFEHISLKYIVTGAQVDSEKVEKAVILSQERYCGVSAMLRKHCPIEWEIEIQERE
jgi:putative redox protein